MKWIAWFKLLSIFQMTMMDGKRFWLYHYIHSLVGFKSRFILIHNKEKPTWNLNIGCWVSLESSWLASSHGRAQNLCWLSLPLIIDSKDASCCVIARHNLCVPYLILRQFHRILSCLWSLTWPSVDASSPELSCSCWELPSLFQFSGSPKTII